MLVSVVAVRRFSLKQRISYGATNKHLAKSCIRFDVATSLLLNCTVCSFHLQLDDLALSLKSAAAPAQHLSSLSRLLLAV